MSVPRRPYLQKARAEAARSLHSRILDAMLGALIVEDFDRITLDAVAASAGTTRQTVVRLFGGKDGLFAALFEREDARVVDSRFAAAGDLAMLVRGVVTDLETNGRFLLRLLRQEARHPILQERFAEARRQHLALLREQFAPLLRRLAPDARELALLQARAVTDTHFWSVLRLDMELEPAAVETVLLDLLRKIFAETRTEAARAAP